MIIESVAASQSQNARGWVPYSFSRKCSHIFSQNRGGDRSEVIIKWQIEQAIPQIPQLDGAIQAKNPIVIRYPWLKGHGSIEGPTPAGSHTAGGKYPWLKGHGSIEGA